MKRLADLHEYKGAINLSGDDATYLTGQNIVIDGGRPSFNIFMNIYFIAEIGINHNGNLEIAKKLIDASKESGSMQ